MLAEIQPSINALLTRVHTELERMERKNEGLLARAELLEGRVGRESGVGAAGGSGGLRRQERRTTLGGKGGPKEQKLRNLTAKRERLEYAVQRLGLQAGQRERQLRKSMAAQ